MTPTSASSARTAHASTGVGRAEGISSVSIPAAVNTAAVSRAKTSEEVRAS